MPTTRKYKAGDYVVLRKRYQGCDADAKPAKVLVLYTDVDGGLRLNQLRAGFYSWNDLDLRPATRKEILAMGVAK